MLDILDWMAEEALAETLKFFCRISGEKSQSRYGTSLFVLRGRQKLLELRGHFAGCGFCRVHDVHMRGRDALE